MKMLFCTLQKQVIQCNSRPMGLRSYCYVLFCYWVTLFIKEELKRKNMSSSFHKGGYNKYETQKGPIERKHRYTKWLGRSGMTRYTGGQNVWVDRPFYLVKWPQEKWACDFHDNATPLTF